MARTRDISIGIVAGLTLLAGLAWWWEGDAVACQWLVIPFFGLAFLLLERAERRRIPESLAALTRSLDGHSTLQPPGFRAVICGSLEGRELEIRFPRPWYATGWRSRQTLELRIPLRQPGGDVRVRWWRHRSDLERIGIRWTGVPEKEKVLARLFGIRPAGRLDVAGGLARFRVRWPWRYRLLAPEALLPTLGAALELVRVLEALPCVGTESQARSRPS